MSGGGPSSDRPSLMRSLGLFVGHVVRGVRSDPAADAPAGAGGTPPEPRRIVASHRVDEQTRDGIILRRTTIEEIHLPADAGGPPPAPNRPDDSPSDRPPCP